MQLQIGLIVSMIQQKSDMRRCQTHVCLIQILICQPSIYSGPMNEVAVVLACVCRSTYCKSHHQCCNTSMLFCSVVRDKAEVAQGLDTRLFPLHTEASCKGAAPDEFKKQMTAAAAIAAAHDWFLNLKHLLQSQQSLKIEHEKGAPHLLLPLLPLRIPVAAYVRS